MDRYYKKRFVPLALPALILFVMVIVIPFIMGVIYSFTAWRGTYFAGGDHFWEAFVGFDNYVKAFKTKKFLDAFVYTIKVTLVAVVAINVVSLAMALLATSLNKGAAAYRTIYFLPNLLGGLALGYIWQFIFEIVFSKILFGEDGIISIPALCNMTQDNTKALLMTRAMVEIANLGEKLGGSRQTFGGLAGMGDLIGLALGVSGVFAAAVQGFVIDHFGFTAHYIMLAIICLIGLIPLAGIRETVPEDGNWKEATADDEVL